MRDWSMVAWVSPPALVRWPARQRDDGFRARLQDLVMECSVHLTKAACMARGSLRRASAKGLATSPVGLAHPPVSGVFFWRMALGRFRPGRFFLRR
jgi:hypothetical protein